MPLHFYQTVHLMFVYWAVSLIAVHLNFHEFSLKTNGSPYLNHLRFQLCSIFFFLVFFWSSKNLSDHSRSFAGVSFFFFFSSCASTCYFAIFHVKHWQSPASFNRKSYKVNKKLSKTYSKGPKSEINFNIMLCTFIEKKKRKKKTVFFSFFFICSQFMRINNSAATDSIHLFTSVIFFWPLLHNDTDFKTLIYVLIFYFLFKVYSFLFFFCSSIVIVTLNGWILKCVICWKIVQRIRDTTIQFTPLMNLSLFVICFFFSIFCCSLSIERWRINLIYYKNGRKKAKSVWKKKNNNSIISQF